MLLFLQALLTQPLIPVSLGAVPGGILKKFYPVPTAVLWVLRAVSKMLDRNTSCQRTATMINQEAIIRGTGGEGLL